MKRYTLALAKMNTGNWKTATSGRDRKKRSQNKSAPKETAKNAGVQPKYDPTAPNPFDAIASDQHADVSHEKQILARPDPSKESQEYVFASSDGDEIVVRAQVLTPRTAYTPIEAKACKQEVQSKPRWGDQSDDEAPTAVDDDRFEPLLRIFNADLMTACQSFEAQLEYVSGFASAVLKLGMSLIKDRKHAVEKNPPSEKELVNDLHVICTHGRDTVRKVEECTKNITAIVNECESKKNTTLDELKNFLLGMTSEKSNKMAEMPLQKASRADTRCSALGVVSHPEGTKVVKRASDLFPRDRGKYSAIVTRDDPVGSQNVDTVSVPVSLADVGVANLVAPLARRDSCDVFDMQQMSIKYATNLGVFLIKVDGVIYSFCNGVFVSRPSGRVRDASGKTGDNTLYGKRCNPGVARCIGAECTYYHDPLTHTNGHTSRNMGVHYVVSELISGVSTDADIIETARGRNKYIVEDIVQLAGMLLIKAFLVKKARENRLSGSSDTA